MIDFRFVTLFGHSRRSTTPRRSRSCKRVAISTKGYHTWTWEDPRVFRGERPALPPFTQATSAADGSVAFRKAPCLPGMSTRHLAHMGAHPGFKFKHSSCGLGYYCDSNPSSAMDVKLVEAAFIDDDACQDPNPDGHLSPVKTEPLLAPSEPVSTPSMPTVLPSVPTMPPSVPTSTPPSYASRWHCA